MTSSLKLLAAAIVALAALPGTARALEKVSIGIVGAASDITVYLAEKKGFLREEGLDGNYLTFDSAAKMIAPLGAGQLDVGAGAWSAGLYNAVDRGIPIKIVADKATNKAPYDYRVVIVRKPLVESGAFKSLADLKGRKIGIVAVGAGDNSSLNQALKSVSLTLDDVERVYLGFPAQVVALSNGGIDVAFSADPNATQAQNQGIAVKFAPYSSFYPVEETGVILFGPSFLEGHRDVAQKFVRAYLKAVRFYDGALKNGKIAGPGADDVIAALGELTKNPDPALYRAMTPAWANPDGRIDMPSLKQDLAFFKQSGDYKGKLSGTELIDGSFVEAALKDIGPYGGPTQ